MEQWAKIFFFLEEVFEVVCGFYQDVYKKVTEINFREFSIFINFKHHGYINGMAHIKLIGENQSLIDLQILPPQKKRNLHSAAF